MIMENRQQSTSSPVPLTSLQPSSRYFNCQTHGPASQVLVCTVVPAQPHSSTQAATPSTRTCKAKQRHGTYCIARGVLRTHSFVCRPPVDLWGYLAMICTSSGCLPRQRRCPF
ncbi:hypothetical protein BDP81DRAFT_418534 [Colletotrichum phormii]|uniref:Uncharacterized protein n=1 Tax=Colletotrichum phormii TaxID=359342 RepID=A0AAJ0A2K1_9PEZI|nr:uncharacterized protein BDP81DRAFT_418534 [Colletotrichum phormii]KAK1641294.1 hypothetical protein BDP81DRAFT_418534 [Colletotrichum phormii]